MKIDERALMATVSVMFSKITEAAIHKDRKTQNAVLAYATGLADMTIILGRVLRLPDDEDLMECLSIVITGEEGVGGKIEELARINGEV